MPIPFSSIPEHLQNSIAKKWNIHDFINFYGNSRLSHAVANKIKTRFTVLFQYLWIHPENEGLEFSYFKDSSQKIRRFFRQDSVIDCPVRLEIDYALITGYMTSESCESLTNFVIATNSYISLLSSNLDDCSPERFNRLLEAARVVRFPQIPAKNLDLIRMPALQRFHELRLEYVDDNDLLHLRMPCLSLTSSNISSIGINLILKEWMTGIRNIEKIYIITSQNLEKSAVFADISYSSVKLGLTKIKGFLLKNTEKSEIAVHLFGYGLIIAPHTAHFFSV